MRFGRRQFPAQRDRPPRLTPLTEAEIRASWDASLPMVSILTSTFMHEQFIEDALCGILAQRTRFPFEVIVRDDASTDGTPDIVADYARRYPTILKPLFESVNTFKYQQPIQVMRREASGQFLAFCEGDDYWTSPEKIELQMSFMENFSWCSLVHHDLTIITEPGNLSLIHENALREYRRTNAFRQERVTGILFPLYGNFVHTASALLRSNRVDWDLIDVLLDREPLPPGDYVTFVVASLGGDVGFLDRALGAYRLHESSYWSSTSVDWREERVQVLHEAFAEHLDGPIGKAFRIVADRDWLYREKLRREGALPGA